LCYVALVSMNLSDFYRLLDELLEHAPGTIKGDEALDSLPRWDSLALMSFIALLDQHFGLIVPASRIAECKKVGDLAALVVDKLR
jgi:acyl carrier protein